MPRKHRARVALPATVDHHMKLYSTAAAAAGVSILAMAQAAEAKVVYTPVNVNLDAYRSFPLDVNGDGIPDFNFAFVASGHSSFLIAELDTVGNAVQTRRGLANFEAGAFPFGAPIGPAQNFASQTFYGGIFMAAIFQYSGSNSWGPWMNVNNRYLGMKFLIDGKVHYGWARFTVRDWFRSVGPHLSGYAYETDPDTKITAGDEGTEKKTAAEIQATPATDTASLGMLAMGAAGLPLWRRD